MELNLWQTCHEIVEKNSKIVPLGAPLFPLYIIETGSRTASALHWLMGEAQL
jgi:hypothetical protein